MADINVKGLAELQAFLDQIPAKMEANVMRAALLAGAKPILAAAKAGVPVGEPSGKGARIYNLYQGALRDSIRVSSRIDNRGGKVTASIKAGGKARKTGAVVFYAHMVEFGTRPHSLSKNGKGEVSHPGVSPRPFMRPALDANAAAAIVGAGEYIKKRLAKKIGLNTAGIEIEVEEE